MNLESLKDVELSFKRALLFLQLAIEQLREADPSLSRKLQSFYTNEISFLFAHHLRPRDYSALTNESPPRVRTLLSLSNEFSDIALKNLAQSPSGLGLSSVSGLPGRAGEGHTNHTAADATLRRLSSQQASMGKEQLPKWPADLALPYGMSLRQPPGIKSLPYRSIHNFGSSNLEKNGNDGDASAPDYVYSQTLSRGSVHKGIVVQASAPHSPLPRDLSALSPSIGDGHTIGKSGRTTIEEFDAYLRRLQDRDKARSIGRRLAMSREKSPERSTPSGDKIVQSNYSAWKENWTLKSLAISSAKTKERSDQAQPQTPPADEQEQTPSLALAVEKSQPSLPKMGNWAKIAAIANSDSPKGLADTPREQIFWSATAAPSSPNHADPLLLGSPRLSYDVDADGQEPYESQLRVVWLHDIPSPFSALQVSRHITTGPLFSLSMEKDVAEHLPGLSACIIFQFSNHAKEFLIANEYSVVFQEDDVEGKQSCPETTQNKGFHNKYHREAPNAFLQLGNPYPILNHDSVFQKMLPPSTARRRVKWARSRLFHSVPITTFKRDIIRLVEGRNLVELWHFYNPGECTVVFASVSVAIKVVEVFKYWAAGKAKYLAKHGSNEVDKIKADGRYAGTEVAFCKDFNETPPNKIISSYGPGNTLGNNLPGYEGLFEGPRVK